MTEKTGKLLKRVRLRDVDRTQAEFAQVLGVAKNTVSTWEQGRLPESWMYLARVLREADADLRASLIDDLAE